MNKEVKLSRDQRKWLRQGDNAVKFGQQMFINGVRKPRLRLRIILWLLCFPSCMMNLDSVSRGLKGHCGGLMPK